MRRPSAADLARLVADQDIRELTYGEHGATAGQLPPGYHHDRWRPTSAAATRPASASGPTPSCAGRSSSGPACRSAPRAGPHGADLLAGVSACAIRRPATRLGHRCGPGGLRDQRPGPPRFAYGTLPGHPECGEEAFHLRRTGTRVVLEVVAFSRPRHPLARLGAPVTRLVQLRINKAHLAGMRALAAELAAGSGAH